MTICFCSYRIHGLVLLKPSLYSMILICFQDYTDRDVVVVSRGRIDDLTSYISDKNTDNHEIEVIVIFL